MAGSEVNPQGVTFTGTRGRLNVRRGRIEAEPAGLLEPEWGPGDVRLGAGNDHKANFLECIRARRDPVAPVEEGHRSNTACILGSLAMQLRRPLHWNPETETFVDDAAADRLRSRPMRRPWSLKAA